MVYKLYLHKAAQNRDFPSGPVAKTLHFPHREPRFDSWSGAKTLTHISGLMLMLPFFQGRGVTKSVQGKDPGCRS